LRRSNGNSLNLAGDGDDVDFLDDVEAVFAVKITDEEAVALRTVGDLHDLLCKRMDLSRRSPCLSARSFRALSAATNMPREHLRPSTPLAVLSGGDERTFAFVRGLNAQTELDVDVTEDHPLAGWILLALVLLPPLFVVWQWANLGAYAFLCVGAWLVITPMSGFLSARLPRRLPKDLRTFGDLAKRVATRNREALTRDGATGTSSDAWQSLVEICRDYGAHRVDRETTFFA